MIHLLGDLIITLTLASIVLVISHRLRVPQILGLILTGVLVGPHGFSLVRDPHEVEIVAEIGVVLLLFTIGLEISFAYLWRMRRIVFGAGGLQVGLTILGATLLFLAFMPGVPRAVFVGCFAALSSTAMVLKLLQDRGETYSPHGRASLGILLFQDLAVVPIMLFLPLLAGAAGGGSVSLGGQLLKTLGVAALVAAGAWIVPRLLYQVVRTGNREVFAISVVAICLVIAGLTEAAGISLALGAFLAGVIISESEFSHDALSMMLPFRHVFASIFFVSIGMLMNLGVLLDQWPLVLPVFLGALLLKAIAVTLAVRLLGFSLRTAIITGLALAQVGEFSFVVLQSASGYELVGGTVYQILLAVAVLSLSATPFLLRFGPWLATRVAGAVPVTGVSPEGGGFDERVRRLQDHIVIAGYGVGGRNVARAAKSCGIPYLILEMNAETVRAVRKAGEPIRYGDVVHKGELRAAGIEKARVLVMMISDPVATRQAIRTAKELNPAIHVIARTRYVKELQALRDFGADQVVTEEFEASVEVFTRVLAAYLVPRSDIDAVATEIRSEGYQMLRKPGSGAFSIRGTEVALPDVEVSAFRVAAGSRLDRVAVAASDLRAGHGVTILALRRGDATIANPQGDEVIQAGDVLILMGSVHALAEVGPVFEGSAGRSEG